MLITQTDIAAFTLSVIANLVKAKPLSEEQASDLLRREKNGLGRKHMLKLLAAQVDKAAERNCEGNNVRTRVGKGLGGNLLDPEVSALCLVSFRLHIIFGRAVVVRTHNRICINKDAAYVFMQVHALIQIEILVHAYRRIFRDSP